MTRFLVPFHHTFPSFSQKVHILSTMLELIFYLQHNLNLCCCIKCSTYQNDKRSVANPPRMRELLNLEDVDFACVFQSLSPVAEPYSHDLSVIVQLSCDFCNLLACWQRVLLKVGVENFYRLRCETSASLAFL